MRSTTVLRVGALGVLALCSWLATSILMRGSDLSAQSIAEDAVQFEGKRTPLVFSSKVGVLKATVTQVHGITQVSATATVQSRDPEALCVWSIVLKDGDGNIVSHDYYNESKFKISDKATSEDGLYKIEPEFSQFLPLQPGRYSFGLRIHYLPKEYDPDRIDEYNYAEGYCLAELD